MKKLICLLIAFLLVLPMNPLARENEDPDLWSTLKPLETTVTFLNTGAHPDDERSDFLAYLSRGLGVKTSSLIANRGEGGQNEIGQELDNALGIIRSREMIEAAKVTGVKAYHLSETTSDPIYDFGFSKTPDETLSKWGEDLTYERLIRFIRTYQPDIVMPSFRDVDSQHGHHRAISILTQRAFEDAADPNVYPEHLEEGLSPWKIKKLYLPAESKESATSSIEIGMFDDIYGKSYPQIGEESRFLHKSQGMGSEIPVAPRQVHLELVKSRDASSGKDQLFKGIPYDFNEWAAELPKKEKSLVKQYQKLQGQLERTISSYPDRSEAFREAQKSLNLVEKATKMTRKAKLDSGLKEDLLHKLSLKEEQLMNVSYLSSDLDVQATSESDVLTGGQQVKVEVNVKNDGKHVLKNADVTLDTPFHFSKKTKKKNLKPGEERTFTFKVNVPEDAETYHPYEEPVIQALVTFRSGSVETVKKEELNGTIAVLPDVGLTMSPEDLVVNTADVKTDVPVSVEVTNYKQGKSTAGVSLDVPEGWTVTPSSVDIYFKDHKEKKSADFVLHPPAEIEEGDFKVEAHANVDGKTFGTTVQEITYSHIGTFYYQYDAGINGVSFELLTPEGMKVGYIESGFDQVADYLSNVGMDITKLTDEDLASGDLSEFDTIVTGIRAYLSRDALNENNDRLKAYVEEGGHLVVQYHKPNDRWDAATTAPYPLTIGNPSIRWRVTDENADVEILKPESSLFSYPNALSENDWDNWVQERGLYYPMDWDSRYETFVRMNDPGEESFDGGILMAPYGEGTYLYTNLVFYRQIQGQVPGGYRIFTNLLSYGQGE
ncbi:PIG-L family deacetylase [Rossellomorea marisflavi]|uniref:PIG-L family deacetylase n=1 Tax=Rossellomorea marisflavi TaxID=189381 RepID=UPI0027A9B830|nr:PIG-L family deacetylase [Rossellomorea marisflavi]UTE73343.1 PIG-L family deacetylase [Rossellomorea marisflavi]